MRAAKTRDGRSRSRLSSDEHKRADNDTEEQGERGRTTRTRGNNLIRSATSSAAQPLANAMRLHRPFVDLASLHDELDVLGHLDVVERVTRDGDEVSQQTWPDPPPVIDPD